MNCREFRSLVDVHELNGLPEDSRSEANAHLAACNNCAAAWRAYDTLQSESFGGPEPGVFEAAMRGVSAYRQQSTPNQPEKFRWRTVAVACSFVATIGLMLVLFGAREDRQTPLEPFAQDIPGSRNAGAPVPEFVEGRDYVRIDSAGMLASADQVVEVFMYGCPPCFQFEPHVGEWAAARSGAIEFARVPVQWNEYTRLHARAYFTAELLGVLDAVHSDFFAEIHEKANPLSTEEQIAALFEKHGVPERDFADAFHSAEVDERLQRAAILAQAYGIDSTPTVIVNGTWLTTGAMARSYENWFAIIDYLVESRVR